MIIPVELREPTDAELAAFLTGEIPWPWARPGKGACRSGAETPLRFGGSSRQGRYLQFWLDSATLG